MLASTNDPIAAARRAQEQAARQAREGTRVGGTEPFQAVRKIQQQIDDLRELVLRMPTYFGRQVDVSDFSMTSGMGNWQTIASTSISRPSQMTRAVVQASASVSAVAGAGATAFETRLVINGTASAAMLSVVEPGGNQFTRGSAFPSFVRDISGLSGSVSVQLQAWGYTWNAFPDQNRASLSVMAGFSTI